MKTIEEKAKAYDEALERARALNNGKDVDVESGTTTCEYIFPELKESEDEKIRKEIISILRNAYWTSNKNRFNELVAWIEKQGKNSTDKPRFKVGDWIVFIKSGSIYQVEKKENYEYTLRYILGGSLCLPFSNEELIREWTIQDAKDGDILSFYNEYKGNKFVQIGIIEKYIGKYGGCSNTFKIYIGVNWDNNLQIGNYMGCSDIHPATKEQRDILMKAMIDAGYKWNAAKKELKKKRKR